MSLYSGRSRDARLEKLKAGTDNEDALNLAILRAVARDEPVSVKEYISDRERVRYAPILKHPLPLSINRPHHEVTVNTIYIDNAVMNTI